ncbi:hypothetical protein MHU86_7598 [Fragilaria crotonensis]|nr:hypothetical protein MHU86_7598 [Fragilaria crotonensis]
MQTVARLGLQALIAHHDGTGELNKRVKRAKEEIARLHYKDERRVFPFEQYVTKLKEKVFVLAKKYKDENLTDKQRVNVLMKGIKSTNASSVRGSENKQVYSRIIARTLTRRPVFCQVLFQIYTQALTWIMQIAILLVRNDMSVRWIRTLGAEAVAGCVVIAAVSVNKVVVDMAAVGVMAEVDKAAATKRYV